MATSVATDSVYAKNSSPDQSYAMRQPEFVNHEGPDAIRQGGYATQLASSEDGEIPDRMRIGQTSWHDLLPVKNIRSWWQSRSDQAQRESVSDVRAKFPKEYQPGPNRVGSNPESHRPGQTRVTESMFPRSYHFTTPAHGSQSTQVPNRFNGLHFSMADHRRAYEILGMKPVSQRRNTFRLTPESWDNNIVDMPPADNASQPNAILLGLDVKSTSGGRGYRL